MKNSEMSYEDKYDHLINIITNKLEIDGKEVSLKEEFEKFFIKGNVSAGIRLRKIMQEIRKTATDIRIDVQSYKKTL